MENLEMSESQKKRVMAIMGSSGDTKVIWDADNRDEVDNAREQFNSLRKKGFLAFSVKKDGEKGEQIKEFDPNAQKLIMVPQLKGG